MWDGFTSTGMASLRRDGFVSMKAMENEGVLTTEKLSFDGKYLFVNVEAGRLLVELLDERGVPIKGYTKEDCIPMEKVNFTKQRVAWKGQSDLGKLAAGVIRIRFYLTNGDLYSFWISPWQSGESRGYTAGGGPGLNRAGIDIP